MTSHQDLDKILNDLRLTQNDLEVVFREVSASLLKDSNGIDANYVELSESTMQMLNDACKGSGLSINEVIEISIWFAAHYRNQRYRKLEEQMEKTIGR